MSDIRFINQNDRIVGREQRKNFLIVLVERERGVKNGQNKLCSLKPFLCKLYTYSFNLVVGLANASGVGKEEGYSAEVYGVFDYVAGGTCNIGYYLAFFARKPIHKGGLSYIWLANDGSFNALS